MKRSTLEGTVKRHPDGFGFFIPEDRTQPDAYIPRQSMKGAMTNDKVRATVYPEGRGGDRFRGEVDEIITRALQKVIARFTPAAYGAGLVEDAEHAWGSNIIIPEGKTKDAQSGELVCVKILDYASASSNLTGEVIEVMGNEADPMLDIRRVVYSQNLPSEFSEGAIAEAHSLSPVVQEREFKNRRDLRELDFVTIDGATAKDFDDAVYVETRSSGFQIWVAIADVSHYVKPGSAIDKDAYERGNSTYFPGFVIPMLPEELSNELCSLKPKVPRLAFVAEMSVDFSGELLKSEFYEAVIQSKARVTYGEAQEVFDGAKPASLNHVADAIQRAGDVAKILMAQRFKNGSLDLEIPDSQIILDAAGNPVDIIRAERLFAHRVIEELMLLANIAVAIYGASKGPFLYRIHEQPAQDNLEMLNRFLIAFGGTKTIEGTGIQKKITKALQQFAGKPQAEVLSMLTLRAMKQAKYAAQNVGHFGLGFNDYTHFTSPIRRYSDLIVHRALKIFLGVYESSEPLSEGTLTGAGTNLSACEQRSAKAERQFKSIKRARFMQGFLGQEFEGLISSVTKFGVFVMLRTYDVDGLIRLEDLGDEPFEFDDENLILIGKRTRMMYSLGDPLKVQVASANPDEGQVSFTLVEKLAATFVSPGMQLGEKAKGRDVESRVDRNSGKSKRGGLPQIFAKDTGGKRTAHTGSQPEGRKGQKRPDRGASKRSDRGGGTKRDESGRNDRGGRSPTVERTIGESRYGAKANSAREPSRNAEAGRPRFGSGNTSRSGESGSGKEERRGGRDRRGKSHGTDATSSSGGRDRLAFGKNKPANRHESGVRGGSRVGGNAKPPQAERAFNRADFPKRNDEPRPFSSSGLSQAANRNKKAIEEELKVDKSAAAKKSDAKPSFRSKFTSKTTAANSDRKFDRAKPSEETRNSERKSADHKKTLDKKRGPTRGNTDDKPANRSDAKKRR